MFCLFSLSSNGRLQLASASSVPKGNVQGTLKLHGTDDIMNTTLITLNNGEFSTYSAPDGSFAFYNVPPGIHVLDVQSLTYVFSQVKIQLLTESIDEPRCIEYYYPGATKAPIAHPIELTALATPQYFEPRAKFSPFVFLKNPMVIMMIFSVGLMLLMPHMMQNLDPEQKEQMRKQMEAQQDPSKMLNQLWGDISGQKDVPKERIVRRIKRE